MENKKHYLYKVFCTYATLIFSILMLHMVHSILNLIIDLTYKENCIILILDYFISFFCIYLLNKYYLNQKINIKIKLSSSYIIKIFLFLYFSWCIYELTCNYWIDNFSLKLFEMSLGASILEEFVFRGIILSLLIKMFLIKLKLKNFAYVLAILFSSLLFSITHLINAITLNQNIFITIIQIIFTISIGIINSIIYIKIENIYIPMLMHFLWDFINSLKLINFDYTNNQIIILLVITTTFSLLFLILNEKTKDYIK